MAWMREPRPYVLGLLPWLVCFERPEEVLVEELSLDVTQWRTMTEKRTSALQHMRQTQAGSPLRTMRMVRFLFLSAR